MLKKPTRFFLEIIKKPVITDKSTKLLELNQYSFIVDKKATKYDIKKAIEYIFNVNVLKINTMHLAPQYKNIGKFKGRKAQHKKAVFTLAQDSKINLFPENT